MYLGLTLDLGYNLDFECLVLDPMDDLRGVSVEECFQQSYFGDERGKAAVCSEEVENSETVDFAGAETS
jgi:hypothetical protein